MAWHVVSVPSSAKTLLKKNNKGDFSPIQKITAAVHYYAGLPLVYRMQLAREYAAQTQREDEGIRDFPTKPSHEHAAAAA